MEWLHQVDGKFLIKSLGGDAISEVKVEISDVFYQVSSSRVGPSDLFRI